MFMGEAFLEVNLWKQNDVVLDIIVSREIMKKI